MLAGVLEQLIQPGALALHLRTPRIGQGVVPAPGVEIRLVAQAGGALAAENDVWV